MISLKTVQQLNSQKKFDQYLHRYCDDSVDKFILELENSLKKLIRTNLNLVEKYIQSLETVFKFLAAEYAPRLLAIKGRYNHWTGNYQQALIYYNQAMDIYRDKRNGKAAARLSKGLMDVNMYLGRYREGLAIGKKALTYFRRNSLLDDAGQILNNIGNIYHRMDNNHLALEYYRKARKIFAPNGGIPLAIIDFNRANILTNMNKIRSAEKLYMQSARIYKEAGLAIAESQANYSIAYLYFLEDRYTEAIRAFESLLTKFQNLGDPKSSAVTQLDLIEINLRLNQYSSVIMLSDQLLPQLDNLGMKYESGKVYYFSGVARTKLEDYKMAAQFLGRAETIMKTENNYLWLGMIEIARSKIYLKQDKLDMATKSAIDSAKYFRISGDKRREIDSDIVKIEALLKSDQTRKAESIAKRIGKQKLPSYQKYNFESIFGGYYYGTKDYKTALTHYKKAVASLEKMISGLYPDEIRYFFVIDKYDCYKMMVDCLIQLGRIKKSFLTNLKALEVLNYRNRTKALKKANIPENLLSIQDSLRADLKRLIKNPENSRRETRFRDIHQNLEHELWQNERKIRALLYPPLEKTDQSSGNNYDNAAILNRDETLLSLFLAQDWLGAFITNGTNTEFVKYNCSPDKIKEILRKFHFITESETLGAGSLTDSAVMANAYLTELYSILIAPIENKIKGRKLLISAEEQLGQIPFIALLDQSGRYLKDKFEIRLVLNPSNLSHRNNPKTIGLKQKSAIFASSSEKLPLIEIEAKNIAKLYTNSELYSDNTATLDNLKKELKQPRSFLHIAAHASRDSENPLFSRILLNDGPFFPFDLFKTGINAKLVTLSGCQTAAPGLYYGNSFSLAKAFYQAGAGYVLASLWTVSDRLSMIFMNQFYRSLAERKEIYKSYISAVEEIIKVADNPAYWSAFILIGI